MTCLLLLAGSLTGALCCSVLGAEYFADTHLPSFYSVQLDSMSACRITLTFDAHMFHKVLASLPRFNAFSGVPLVLGALGKGEEFGD